MNADLIKIQCRSILKSYRGLDWSISKDKIPDIHVNANINAKYGLHFTVNINYVKKKQKEKKHVHQHLKKYNL